MCIAFNCGILYGYYLSTEGLGPRHGEVRRVHQMLNAALVSRINTGEHHIIVSRTSAVDVRS